MPKKSWVKRFKESQKISKDKVEPLERRSPGSSTTNEAELALDANTDRHGRLREVPVGSADHRLRLRLSREQLIRLMRLHHIWTPVPHPGDPIFREKLMGYWHASEVPIALLRVGFLIGHRHDRALRIAFERRYGIGGLPKEQSDLAFKAFDSQTHERDSELRVRLMGSGYWQKDVRNLVWVVRKESLLRNEL